MAQLPSITANDAIRAFRQFGFLPVRTGRHIILKKANHPYLLAIPNHPGRTLGLGLLHDLIKAAGITRKQFLEAL
ncbi:MAG: type II toxin-antitoxin system HicA family toxin [Planctomycetes bacterium]|nr:type II toxin-antitoxin system HicA family toxin [Planctomycetota bacterium]